MKYILIILFFLTCQYVSSKEDRFVTHVTLTSYNAVKEQCNNDPLHTADGTKIDHKKVKNGTQRIVAVSRDLLWCIPLGSVVHIEGYGVYEVRDTMNKRYEHCMDILQHKNAPNFKKHKIKVVLLSRPHPH